MLFVDVFEMALFGRFLLQTQFPVGQVATASYFNPALVEPGALHQIDAARAKGLAALAGGDGQPDVGVPPSRMLEKVRQRQMEDRLMVQTRTYLHNQEPARVASAAPAGKAESGIEILARAIDGRKLPIEDFRKFTAIASLLPVAGMPSGLSMIGASRTLPRRCPSLRPCR